MKKFITENPLTSIYIVLSVVMSMFIGSRAGLKGIQEKGCGNSFEIIMNTGAPTVGMFIVCLMGSFTIYFIAKEIISLISRAKNWSKKEKKSAFTYTIYHIFCDFLAPVISITLLGLGVVLFLFSTFWLIGKLVIIIYC